MHPDPKQGVVDADCRVRGDLEEIALKTTITQFCSDVGVEAKLLAGDLR